MSSKSNFIPSSLNSSEGSPQRNQSGAAQQKSASPPRQVVVKKNPQSPDELTDEAFLAQFNRHVARRSGRENPKGTVFVNERMELPKAERPIPLSLSISELTTSLRSNGLQQVSLPKLEDLVSKPAEPAESVSVVRMRSSMEAPAPSRPLPSSGAIVLLRSGKVGVFHKSSQPEDQKFDALLMLNPDGTLSPESANILADGDWRAIGQIPPDHLPHLAATLSWNRNHIVFHLESIDCSQHIPRINPSAPRPRPAVQTESTRNAEWPNPSEDEPKPAAVSNPEDSIFDRLRRGQRFTVAFSKDRTWDAVFWCQDNEGSVVAYKTGPEWALIRMDLTRFKDSLVLSNMLSEFQISEIDASLLRGKK